MNRLQSPKAKGRSVQARYFTSANPQSSVGGRRDRNRRIVAESHSALFPLGHWVRLLGEVEKVSVVLFAVGDRSLAA